MSNVCDLTVYVAVGSQTSQSSGLSKSSVESTFVHETVARHFEPSGLRFEVKRSGSGRPVLEENCRAAAGVDIGISHVADSLVVALGQDVVRSPKFNIGVDIELVKPRRMADRRDSCQRIFGSMHDVLDLKERRQLFYRAWVCREAVVKMFGYGYSYVDQVELLVDNPESGQIELAEFDGKQAYISEFVLPESELIGAICATTPINQVSFCFELVWRYVAELHQFFSAAKAP